MRAHRVFLASSELCWEGRLQSTPTDGIELWASDGDKLLWRRDISTGSRRGKSLGEKRQRPDSMRLVWETRRPCDLEQSERARRRSGQPRLHCALRPKEKGKPGRALSRGGTCVQPPSSPKRLPYRPTLADRHTGIHNFLTLPWLFHTQSFSTIPSYNQPKRLFCLYYSTNKFTCREPTEEKELFTWEENCL